MSSVGVDYIARNNKEKRWNDKKKSNQKEYKCKYFDKVNKPRNYPAYGKSCRNCGGRNHFYKVCKKSRQGRAEANVDLLHGNEETKDFYVNAINNSKADKWTENLNINGKFVTFVLDTGSHANILPLSVFKSIAPKNVP